MLLLSVNSLIGETEFNRKKLENVESFHSTNNYYFRDSKTLFRWLKDLLQIGLSRPIVDNDIYQTLKCHDSKAKTDAFEIEWRRECCNKSNPKLLNILRRIYARRVILWSVLFTVVGVLIR